MCIITQSAALTHTHDCKLIEMDTSSTLSTSHRYKRSFITHVKFVLH